MPTTDVSVIALLPIIFETFHHQREKLIFCIKWFMCMVSASAVEEICTAELTAGSLPPFLVLIFPPWHIWMFFLYFVLIVKKFILLLQFITENGPLKENGCVLEIHLCKYSSDESPAVWRLLILCWEQLTAWRLAVSVWGTNSSSTSTSLSSLCFLALSLSLSLIHTNTRAVEYQPMPQAIQNLRGNGKGGGGRLTPDELAMGMTSPWPHCSLTQLIPTV